MGVSGIKAVNTELRNVLGGMSESNCILVYVFDIKDAFRIWAGSEECNLDGPVYEDLREV